MHIVRPNKIYIETNLGSHVYINYVTAIEERSLLAAETKDPPATATISEHLS